MTSSVIFSLFIWAFLFTRCDAADFSVDGTNLKYKGSSVNTETVTMYLKKEELDLKFSAYRNPEYLQTIKLSIDDCVVYVYFMYSDYSAGRFMIYGSFVPTLTVPSSSISCNPTFEPIGNGYQVKVKIELALAFDSTDFEITFENVSLDPSFVEEKKNNNWIWITCVAVVVVAAILSLVVGIVVWFKICAKSTDQKAFEVRQSKTVARGRSKNSEPEHFQQDQHYRFEPLGSRRNSNEKTDNEKKFSIYDPKLSTSLGRNKSAKLSF